MSLEALREAVRTGSGVSRELRHEARRRISFLNGLSRSEVACAAAWCTQAGIGRGYRQRFVIATQVLHDGSEGPLSRCILRFSHQVTTGAFTVLVAGRFVPPDVLPHVFEAGMWALYANAAGAAEHLTVVDAAREWASTVHVANAARERPEHTGLLSLLALSWAGDVSDLLDATATCAGDPLLCELVTGLAPSWKASGERLVETALALR